MAAGALTEALANLIPDVGLEPLGDRILVLRDPKREISSGGLVIADVAQAETDTGVIVAVPGFKSHWTLQPGDRIVFGVHSGDKLPDEFQADPKNPRLVTMRAAEVWARVK